MQLGQRTFSYLVSLLFIYLFAMNPAHSDQYLGKYDTPNFQQSNTDFKDDGEEYCAPAAVSNALMWLGKHGYPGLIPKARTEVLAQTEMISILGSSHYMNTADYGGTTMNALLRGLIVYVEACGYSIKHLEYRGNSNGYKKYRGGSLPELNWTADHIPGLSGVCLHFGWYKYNRQNNTYTRTGGHWVTVISSADQRSNPQFEPTALVVHNPESTDTQTFVMQRISNGTLYNPFHNSTYGQPTLNAAGTYKIVEGLQSHKIPIFEDSVVFYLNQR